MEFSELSAQSSLFVLHITPKAVVVLLSDENVEVVTFEPPVGTSTA